MTLTPYKRASVVVMGGQVATRRQQTGDSTGDT